MLQTAMIFGDGMVFQQEKPIPVWGTADPGSKVELFLDQETVIAEADDKGEWRAEFSPRPAGRNLKMILCCNGSRLEYSDICMGEVWIAGGQSNMEFFLGHEAHYEEVLASYENRDVRFFDYPEVCYEGALSDWNYEKLGIWRKAVKEDLAYFSAVGFYFARNLQASLDVPVGIIGCNWGGSPACTWMDPSGLKGTAGEVWLEDYEKNTQNLDLEQYLEDYKKNPMNDRSDMLNDSKYALMMKTGLSRDEQKEVMKKMNFSTFSYEQRPGGLYETMLKKLVPYGIRGVIWYQGETDGDFHPEAYQEVFSAMIKDWRALWREELPFLFVQLAPFGEWMACKGNTYGIVRSCQEAVSKTVPGTWMATTGDVGMEWDIHPKNKRPVGERLALLARGHVYKETLLCDPPEAVSAERNGKEVIVKFLHADGLFLKGDALQAMQAVNKDGTLLPVTQAEVQKDRLILHGAEEVAELLFGETDYYEVNLYNEAQIPAKPFRMKICSARIG